MPFFSWSTSIPAGPRDGLERARIRDWRLHHPMDPKTWSEDYVKAQTGMAPPR